MPFSLSNFFFNSPLYQSVMIENPNTDTQFRSLFSLANESFEGFNPQKKENSTFNVLNPIKESLAFGGVYAVQAMCRRYGSIFYFYIIWQPGDNILTKIGQFPSVADFHIGEIKRFKKVLPHEKLTEFTKAIGLSAVNVGIGSYVYLRRIWEYLIEEAYQNGKEHLSTTEADYRKMRWDEKIDLLKDLLPSFLTENKIIYGILSKGIHELDEQSCLAYFTTLRLAIEEILEEKLEILNRDARRKNRQIELQKIQSQLKQQ